VHSTGSRKSRPARGAQPAAVAVRNSLLAALRRVSITGSASRFQAAALISYRRGRISVLDKPSLQKQSCECYRFIRQQYESLHAELPRLLSGR